MWVQTGHTVGAATNLPKFGGRRIRWHNPQQSAHLPGFLHPGPALGAPASGGSVRWRRRSSACESSMTTWMAARQGDYLFPYLVFCLIGNLPSVSLAVQRPCCYGRTTQFYSDYKAILLHCSSPQGSCHCACFLPSAPVCHVPWRRLQDNIHIRQVGQVGPYGICWSLWRPPDMLSLGSWAACLGSLDSQLGRWVATLGSAANRAIS